eukprot:8548622-Lingulodinium_polyedra.AAC.1
MLSPGACGTMLHCCRTSAILPSQRVLASARRPLSTSGGTTSFSTTMRLAWCRPLRWSPIRSTKCTARSASPSFTRTGLGPSGPRW